MRCSIAEAMKVCSLLLFVCWITQQKLLFGQSFFLLLDYVGKRVTDKKVGQINIME
jgi:hypothetical protein